jgi:hypothetical protein
MKTINELNRMKLELMQGILALQDMSKLQRIKAVLEQDEPTPQHLLDLIDRGLEESKAGQGRPVEEFLEEIKGW